MARSLAGLLVAMALVFGAPRSVPAQEYRFRVPEMTMLVVVNSDASVRIAYDITFENAPGAHPIDIVDIGTPDARYDLGNVRATIDGALLRDVRPSSYIAPGFEVHLAPMAIPPGGRGTLHVEFTMPDRVYQDTTRSDLASLRMTPTWWGDPYVLGTTDLRIAFQLPRGVKPDEVLHQGVNFTLKALSDEGTLVGWRFPDARMNDSHAGRGAYRVAASFPKRDLSRVVVKTKLDMLLEWFAASAPARWTLGAVVLALLGFAFFRFTGGTGFSVFAVVAIAAVVVFAVSPGLHLLSLPLVVALAALGEWARARRRGDYMPPIAEVEGGGIKRGLTAPEAAALLELPIGRVLGLVIFGLLKKGVLRVRREDPLVVDLDEAYRPGPADRADADARAAFRRQVAQQRGVVIHGYEPAFLDDIELHPGRPVHEIDFSAAMRGLIERVASRMKGFDVSDTQDYYRAIVRRAVELASSVGEIAQRQRTVDRNFEWILIDDGYPTVFRGWGYRPPWMRPAGLPRAAPGAPPTAAPSSPAAPPTLTDVSASFARWSENTFGRIAAGITPGALRVGGPGGGFIDLSGADRLTGQFFQALAESAAKGGGGGGGGGCACACAGCACACACAGGGR